MSVWQKEPGSCTGRGFDSAGFLGKLYSWITRAPSSNVVAPFGGPAWYIWDDRSGISPSPYIVISNVASPTPNASRAKFIRVLQDASFPGRIFFQHYFYWNNVSHTGVGLWHVANLGSVDAGPFAYDFRGGDDGMQWGTLIGANYCYHMIMEWDAITNFCEPASILGTLQTPFFQETDPGNYLSRFDNISSVTYGVNTDANGYIYFSLINTSGSTYRIDAFKDSARTIRVGFTSTFTNTATGAKNFTADNTTVAGITGNVTLDITAVAVTNINCRFFWFTLGTGEGALFTVGNWYFMTDFSQGQAWITYCKVSEKSGDSIRVDRYFNDRNFSATSLFGAYPHRWVAYSNRYNTSGAAGAADAGTTRARLPYFSRTDGQEFTSVGNSFDATAGFDYMQETLGNTSPGDDTKYAGQRPVIYELQSVATSGGSSPGNRSYGKMRACYVTSPNGIGIYLSGRSKDGIDYLRIGNSSSLAFLIQDTIFTS